MRRRTVAGIALIVAGIATWSWCVVAEHASTTASGSRDPLATSSVAERRATSSITERLLGPIASLASSLQWVRVDQAWNHGRPELADRRAQFALELAPADPAGWLYYARHLIYDRASRLREPDRANRERWIRAGLDVLDRAERECHAPGHIAFQRGVVFVALSQVDDAERGLPITRREAWVAAAESFERAAQAGEPLAREAAAAARRRARDQAP